MKWLIPYHDAKPGWRAVGLGGQLRPALLTMRKGQNYNVYIAMQMKEESRIKKLMRDSGDTTCSVILIPDVFTFNILHSRIEEVNGVPVVPLYDTPLSGINRVLKRPGRHCALFTDPSADLPGAVLHCPAVKLSSPGPVIFRQTRYGMDGKPIMVWKFPPHEGDGERQSGDAGYAERSA